MRTLQAKTDQPRLPDAVAAQASMPVKWWASVGGGFLALQVYLLLRWVLSGHLARVPNGVDAVPTYMLVAIRAHEVIGVVSFVGIMYWHVVRPWRRERRVPLFGCVALASFTIFWQDTALNWAGPHVVWNTAFVNFGSWYNFIPGWISPRGGRIPQPILFDPLVYALFFAAPAFLFAWCMRKAKARFPTIGVGRLLLVGFLAAALLDLAVEVPWCLLGVYSYAGVKPWLTLFPGHYYQFPLYEAVFWGAAWASAGALIYFRDDRGETLVHRGIERLRTGPGATVAVRVLAIGAFLNVAFIAYNLVFGLMVLEPGARWSADAVNRSYLRGELCGEGTPYACPGADLPLPRGEGGSRVDPSGQFVVPLDAPAHRYN
jgi:hypothetical protein